MSLNIRVLGSVETGLTASSTLFAYGMSQIHNLFAGPGVVAATAAVCNYFQKDTYFCAVNCTKIPFFVKLNA